VPLTDNQQAIIVLISGILIAIGGITIPTGYPWYVTLALMIAGAVGFALKEKAGSVPPKT
jgi:hypothetical protein